MMRVFVAGASGAIGTRLVPKLTDRGHRVIGTSTSRESAERVRSLGAEAITLDLLAPRAVRKAVLEAEPDAIIHQATALADVRFSRNMDRTFAQTNRLRTEGTDALLAAARQAGVRRFIAQSFASYRYAREGGPVKTEDDPLDPDPLPTTRESQAAMRYLAQALGAKPPRRVPRWLARLVAGEAAVMIGTEARGASNVKAKRELGWTLRYPSWRQGFAAVYATPGASISETRTPMPANVARPRSPSR